MFSEEALYALYKHDGYYSSRINVNMHLTRTKTDLVSLRMNKNSIMQTQNMTQTCNI